MSLGARRRRPPTPSFVANELWRRAGAVPSFHIAPARTRNATDLITGSVLGTYNSASPAWAVGPDGVLFQPAANAPVIEYDPVTLACLGARIWGVVTNLFLQSNSIGVSPWGTNNPGSVTYTSNAALSPAGVVNARRITATADFAGPNQFAAVTSGTTYTVSFFVKAVTSGSLDELRLELFGYQLRFKISTQAFSQVNANFTAYGAINYGNGWYRLYASAPAPSTGSLAASLYAYQSADVYAWGAQFQAGPLAPYVPTTTLAASSTADAWSITGADFSRIWNQSAVTLYADAGTPSAVPSGLFPRVVVADDAATRSNQVQLAYYSAGQVNLIRTAAGVQAEFYPSIFAQNYPRTALAVAADNIAGASNGTITGTDNAAIMPTVDRLLIGNENLSSNFLNGYIRELAIFRSRRPNANLQAMTS